MRLSRYLDNRGNSRANTCIKGALYRALYLLDQKPLPLAAQLVNHSNFSDGTAFNGARGSIDILPYQLVGSVVDYRGGDGTRRIRVRLRTGGSRIGRHF
jgi:hypothetical protein